MILIRRLTPQLRRKLKAPLGLLIRGSVDQTMQKLGRLVEEESPPMVISVGDVVSESMTGHGILPKVLAVDNRVMRKPIAPIPLDVGQTLHVKNPPGTLTDEAWTVMRKAVGNAHPTRVLVEGEEDLLTLVAVLCAPEGSLVVYGQPGEGVVAVKATEEKKRMVRSIVEAMETVSPKKG